MMTAIAPRRETRVALPKTPAEGVLAGLLAENTVRAYQIDIRQFEYWMDDQEFAIADLTPDHLVAYRDWLRAQYTPATVNRKLSVVRQYLDEARARGLIDQNPADRLKGLRVTGTYSPTEGLTREEARRLLDSIETKTLLGKRDYAILSLMLRTGLRRAEVSALTTGDLGERQGHHVLRVRGKGGAVRLAKVPVDVRRHLAAWLEAAGIAKGSIFRQVRKFGRGEKAEYRPVGTRSMTPEAIWLVVKRRAKAASIERRISPHSLRHTFITLALQGGAPLHKAQYAAGHADPRTTERYDRQRDNLDDNAVDYVKI